MKIYNKTYLIGSVLLTAAFILSYAAGSKAKQSQSTVNVKKDNVITRYVLQEISSLPEYDSRIKTPLQIDLRDKDLSGVDVENNLNDLLRSSFSTATKWPSKLPEGFEPSKIVEQGKNPGLGVRNLHLMGITGKNIGVAIIGPAILEEHVEYKDSIKVYKQMHSLASAPSIQGTASASIVSGKNVGVAPEADLYYIDSRIFNTAKAGNPEADLALFIEAVDEVLEINKTLEADKKIRVIAAAVSVDPKELGYQEFVRAVEKAKNENIFLITNSLQDSYKFCFDGLSKLLTGDPENVENYRPAAIWSNAFYNGFYSADNIVKRYDAYMNDVLFFPMDARTTASELDNNQYAFINGGSRDLALPYIAGLYALGCQVDPQLTPEKFWQKAVETGDTIKFDKEGQPYELKKVVNPVKLMEGLK